MGSRESGGVELEPRENIESRVILNFLRHGEKNSDPEVRNEQKEVSAKGREDTAARGEEIRLSKTVI